ncbi:hypothetical protein AK830_g10818 [Neonectria ditissima]|uniref:Glyoxalase/fosfomycin resistance/dioxygenase domain-containing protein n=1 Tax=Neonectria ditissima TaxID=78410 RepID=A0A0P7ASJ7_9HYPO|nr:hypothetical protein AK830_g10818 [Neonectria ditissima]
MWSLPSQITSATMSPAVDFRTPSPTPSLMDGSSPTNSQPEQRTPSPVTPDQVRLGVITSKGFEDLRMALPRPSKETDATPISTHLSTVETQPETTICTMDEHASYRNCRRPDAQPSDFIMISCFDIQRAQTFYSRCFGWTFLGDLNRFDPTDENMMQHGSSPFDLQAMNFFTSDTSAQSHDVTGALIQREEPPHKRCEVQGRAWKEPPTCHFRVTDIGAAADRIEANFGWVKNLRFGIRQGIMDYGEFMDPEGNLFGLVAFHPEVMKQSC